MACNVRLLPSAAVGLTFKAICGICGRSARSQLRAMCSAPRGDEWTPSANSSRRNVDWLTQIARPRARRRRWPVTGANVAVVLALDDAARHEHRRSGRESAKRDERGDARERGQCATERRTCAELARDCRYAPLLEHPLRQVVCAEVKCDDADGRSPSSPLNPPARREASHVAAVARGHAEVWPAVNPSGLVLLVSTGGQLRRPALLGCVGAMLPVVHPSHRAHPACIHVVLCGEQRVQMESVGAKLAATVGDAVAER